jgi:GNAT superfamily N-acetyltransferase
MPENGSAMPTITSTPITSSSDPLFIPWLDLYETAFPPREKILVSTLLKILQQGSDGTRLAALLDETEQFAGMMMYQVSQEHRLALLWYFAILPDLRSKGLGGIAYRQLIQNLDPATCKGLFFEVEIPDEHNREEAERRIAFYRRNGAFVLDGIEYMQYVGWHQPPTPMHIMVHPLVPLTPQEAYDTARLAFEDTMKQTGVLSLR